MVIRPSNSVVEKRFFVKVDFKIGNKSCDDYDLKESWENVRSVVSLFCIKRCR